MLLWHNSAWKEARENLLCADDRLRYGDGVFDTALLAFENGESRIIHGQRHHARLLHDAGVMEMAGGSLPALAAWQNAAQELAARNDLTQGRYILNTLVSRGPMEGALSIVDQQEPQVIMRLRPLPEGFPLVKAVISSVRRNEGSPLSQIKSCNYGDNILALAEAKARGGNETFMLNNAGNIACASTSNIFTVINDELITPPLSDGAMAGIIRALLIERMGAREASLSPEDLKNAQGIYITNSVQGVRIVTSLEGSPLPVPSLTIHEDFHLDE